MKKKNGAFLAIDLGASSGRAIAGYLQKGELHTREIYRFPNEPVNLRGNLYWNVLAIYEEVKNSLKKYGTEFDRELSSIGIDSWGVDFGLLDDNGDLISTPVHYRDDRTEGVLKKAFRVMARKEIFSRTGNQFLPFNTLFQLLVVKSNKGYQLDNADTLLMMGDLFSYFLTDRKKTEFSLATTTQLFNPLEKKWSKEIFENYDLPVDIMPEVCQTGTKIGNLSENIREEVNVDKVPVIATTTHDTASAVSAVPARSEGWVFISSGTWSLLGVEVEEPVLEEEVMEANFTNEGCYSGKFTLHKNLTGLWILQECKRKWDEKGDTLSYGRLTELAREARGFNSFINTERDIFAQPGDMPAKISKYCRMTDQKPPENKAEMIRSILEGLAFNYRLSINQLKSITERQFDRVHIVGGGAKNELLSQFCANATGLTVISGPKEATAMGNILNQAVSMSRVESIEDSRALVRNSSEIKTYNPENLNTWDRAYEKFKKIRETAS
jgi:rhamnulokinase